MIAESQASSSVFDSSDNSFMRSSQGDVILNKDYNEYRLKNRAPQDEDSNAQEQEKRVARIASAMQNEGSATWDM